MSAVEGQSGHRRSITSDQQIAQLRDTIAAREGLAFLLHCTAEQDLDRRQRQYDGDRHQHHAR
jgi:hypothetical protein